MTYETGIPVGRRALVGGAVMSALAAAVGLTACGNGKKQKSDGPVDVEPGDTCARCGMHIADMRHVGEIIGAKDVWKFDDVGELFVYYQEEGLTDGDAQAVYVKGYDTGRWVEADSAHYVVAPDVATPMGTHVLALAKEESVGTYTASESARETTYDDLLANPPEAMEMGDGMGGGAPGGTSTDVPGTSPENADSDGGSPGS